MTVQLLPLCKSMVSWVIRAVRAIKRFQDPGDTSAFQCVEPVRRSSPPTRLAGADLRARSRASIMFGLLLVYGTDKADVDTKDEKKSEIDIYPFSIASQQQHVWFYISGGGEGISVF